LNLARSCGQSGSDACAAAQSKDEVSLLYPAFKANDGKVSCNRNANGYYDFSHTADDGSANSWWRLDFGGTRKIAGGIIWGRCDCCQSRLDGFRLWIGSSTTYNGQGNTNCYTATTSPHNFAPYTHAFTCTGEGRYFFVQLPSTQPLTLLEVQVNSNIGKFE
jgi:hypothetical protein